MFNSLRVAAFLALKSIVRGNLWVFVLTITMLMLVFLNLIFAPSLINGVVKTVNDKIIKTLSGDIVVESTGAEKEIGNVTLLMSEIESVQGVEAVCARNDIAADIFHEGERASAIIYSIDPDRDKEVFGISDYIIEGSYLAPDDTDQILLGLQLAGSDREDLEFYTTSLKHVHAGDSVVVNFANGMQKQFTVKGIFQVELIQADIQAFITEKSMESISPIFKDRASSLHIRTYDDSELQPVIDAVKDVRQELRFQTWHDIAGVLRSMTDTLDQIIAILQLIALVVAAITIFIITYVDLVNKRKQIGIQRAIGITSVSIVLSYIIRAIFYAVTGTIIAGLVFAYIIMPLEARHPFHFPFGEVPLVLEARYLATSAVILWGVATVSAFIPAWQTIRIKIIDAIWSQ